MLNPAQYFAAGSQCPVCLKQFSRRPLLIEHLGRPRKPVKVCPCFAYIKAHDWPQLEPEVVKELVAIDNTEVKRLKHLFARRTIKNRPRAEAIASISDKR